MQLPGKADAAREKILEEKVNSIANEIVETLISENIKNIVVSGPGFLKEKLAKTIKEILKLKGVSVNVIVGHSSTGGVKGVFETTKSETIRKVIKAFELAEKEKLFEEVMKNLSLNTGKVALGINEVMKAAELGAIEYLLVLDRTLKDLASGSSGVLEKILSNVEKYNGKIPNKKEVLIKLPGVKEYTANAMLIFSYNYDLPLVDTNTLRLIKRLFGLNKTLPPHNQQITNIIASLIPKGKSKEFNLAMLDLASTVCTAKNPKCHLCPLYNLCEYHMNTIIEER